MTADHDAVRVHRLCYVLLSVFLCSCQGGIGTMSENREEPDLPEGSFRVVLDASVPAGYVIGSRKAEELAAIAAILSRTPVEHRGRMRAVLEDPDVHFTASTDPEIARLMGVIASIRLADASDILRRALKDQEEDRRESQARVHVVVALLPAGNAARDRVTVVLRPEDGGRPLVLLRESDATAEDLESGLRLAAVSSRRLQSKLSQEMRLTPRPASSTRPPPVASPASAAKLDLLRTSPMRQVAGIGSVRALDIMARPKQRQTP